MKPDFCIPNCKFMNPTEEEQTFKKEAHICTYFNQRLYYGIYHPQLIKIKACSKKGIKNETKIS